MNTIRLFLFSLLFTVALDASAQESATQRDLQQAMTEAEFKAAGLDKLSATELAALNAWLQRKVIQETEVAVAAAKETTRKEVQQENRGFFDFGSKEPIESSIAGEFAGFAKGRQYTLANGQVWEQVEPASLAGVRKSNPAVVIKPSVIGNRWFMRIEGYNTAAPVRRIK
ncbi:hypothetical protein [Pseudoxanthomonas sp. UTMC 1351]|uniref:hypothetical protein n=1 Tax=Pseudoxanthomonas sp. UTMC 1351 TaxID=2695853 RepID=UPI0034CEB647